MKLLTEELRQKLPALAAQDGNPNPRVYLKLFTPESNWTWYATEGEPEGEDFRFFGYVCGFENEWGYFMLSELESALGPLGLRIERDINFKEGPFNETVLLLGQ